MSIDVGPAGEVHICIAAHYRRPILLYMACFSALLIPALLSALLDAPWLRTNRLPGQVLLGGVFLVLIFLLGRITLNSHDIHFHADRTLLSVSCWRGTLKHEWRREEIRGIHVRRWWDKGIEVELLKRQRLFMLPCSHAELNRIASHLRQGLGLEPSGTGGEGIASDGEGS